MQRYFFDLIDGGYTEHDFKGSEFENAGLAKQHAELIALDLGMSADPREPSRREIKMRNIAGALLFVVPVRGESDLLAA